MDVDLLDSSKTSEEDQMEMMMMTMMMHQMDKLPEFAGPGIGTGLTYPDLPSSSSSSINFSSGNHSSCTAPVVPLIFDNTSVSSPALSSPSSFPFMTSMAPEDEALIPVGGFLSNIAFTGKFRNAGEIISSGASAFSSSPSSSTSSSSSYPFQQKKNSSMAAMREMIFRIAAMQPIHIDPESVKPPKRRNVKISKDPQSVAARHRRERISERIRILQRLVPGGTKMDTASMLDEAIHYVKFLKGQVQSLERAAATTAVASTRPSSIGTVGYPVEMANAAGNYTSLQLGKASSSYQRGGAAQVVFSPTEMLS